VGSPESIPQGILEVGVVLPYSEQNRMGYGGEGRIFRGDRTCGSNLQSDLMADVLFCFVLIFGGGIGNLTEGLMFARPAFYHLKLLLFITEQESTQQASYIFLKNIDDTWFAVFEGLYID
jgi:hypothetical protein